MDRLQAQKRLMRSGYLLLAVLWSTYCFVHSALISAKAIHFIKRVLGTRYAY